MERRQFIRTGCKLCVGFAGVSALASVLSSCTPLPIYNTTFKDKQITVPLTQFEKTNFILVRCSNLNYDIAVIKQADGNFRSLYMQCTHAETQLDFNGNEFTCSLHGSVFTNNGEVKKGPAERPLVAFQTTTESDHLLIKIGK